jgi:hypothetical protein
MCQNPSGRILKNPAKYAFEIADAISKPIVFDIVKEFQHAGRYE